MGRKVSDGRKAAAWSHWVISMAVVSAVSLLACLPMVPLWWAVAIPERTKRFRWTAESGMVGLGFAPGDRESTAVAVSADGNTVVGYSGSALIWRREFGMRHVRDVLVSDYGLDLAGWSLTSATGVSADGQVIAGSGVNPSGKGEAWIAVLGPSLEIARAGTNIILSWRTNDTGFSLEETSSPVSSTQWTTYLPAVYVIGDHFVVTNTTSTEQRFFRLRKP